MIRGAATQSTLSDGSNFLREERSRAARPPLIRILALPDCDAPRPAEVRAIGKKPATLVVLDPPWHTIAHMNHLGLSASTASTSYRSATFNR